MDETCAENCVCEDFVSSLNDLTLYNNGPHIQMLTEIVKNIGTRYAAEIVFHVESHLRKVKPDLLLPGIFLIDSIIKMLGNEYVNLFGRNIVHTFCRVCEKVGSRTRSTLYEIRRTWVGFFPDEQLHAIDRRINEIDRLWPMADQFRDRRRSVNEVVKHFPIKKDRRSLQTRKVNEGCRNNYEDGYLNQFDGSSNRDRREINFRTNYSRKDKFNKLESQFDNSRRFYKRSFKSDVNLNKNSFRDTTRNSNTEYEEPPFKRTRLFNENFQDKQSKDRDDRQIFPTVYFHATNERVTTRPKFVYQNENINRDQRHGNDSQRVFKNPNNALLDAGNSRRFGGRHWKRGRHSAEDMQQKNAYHKFDSFYPSARQPALPREKKLPVELNSFPQYPKEFYSQKIEQLPEFFLKRDIDQRNGFDVVTPIQNIVRSKQLDNFAIEKDIFIDQRHQIVNSVAIQDSDERNIFNNIRHDASPSPQSSVADLDITELMRNLKKENSSSTSSSDDSGESPSREEPTPQIDFSLKCLRGRKDEIINRLHAGKPCSSCGRRFQAEERDEYNRHLDWHFTINRSKRNNKVESRKWYIDIHSWIQFFCIDTTEENKQCFFQVAEIAKQPTENIISIPATNTEADISCSMCGDKFVLFWNDEEDEWRLKNAVRVDDAVYHLSCCEDA